MRPMHVLAMAGPAVLLMAACGGGGGNGTRTPTSGLTIPSSTAPPSLPSGIPTSIASPIPSGLPSGNVGSLTRGTAHLEVSGDGSTTVDLPRLETGVFAPGTAIGLTWTDSSGDTFAIGGVAFTGSATTSTTLTLSFATTSPQILAAASTAGECTIALSDASPGHVQGTADCRSLQVSGKSVNLHAEFDATS